MSSSGAGLSERDWQAHKEAKIAIRDAARRAQRPRSAPQGLGESKRGRGEGDVSNP
jgi:hypothetical protein